jgi:hypothetical protein
LTRACRTIPVALVLQRVGVAGRPCAADPELVRSERRLASGYRSGPGWLGCWATSDPLASQLLIVVASTQPPTSGLEDATVEWLAGGFDAVGVVGAGDHPYRVLPTGRRWHAL